MRFSDAQWKTLKRLNEAQTKGCEYIDIMRAGGNGHTLRWLVDRELIRLEKTFGTKFWYITDAGMTQLLATG